MTERKITAIAHYLITVALLSVAYYITGRLGLMLAVPPGFATIIWPPSGIALGALLLFGVRLWPGIVIGSFLINAHIAGAFSLAEGLILDKTVIAMSIAIGSTLQALLARALIRKIIGLPLVLNRARDIFGLFMLAGPVGCLVAPTFGVTTLYAAGAVLAENYLHNWFTWWAGDMFGMLVFLPLMLIAPGSRSGIAWKGGRLGTLPAAAMLMLMLPLGLTFYAWKTATHIIYEKNQEEFVAQAQDNEQSLLNRIGSYEQVLLGAVGFIQGSEFVSRDEWRAYVDIINIRKTHSGIYGIGWIVEVKTSDIPSFLEKNRADRAPGFTIHPQGKYPGNFLVKYIEPMELNGAALGLNIAFENNRYATAILARDSGNAAITRHITLAQDQTRKEGFLLLVPMYRKRLPISTVTERRAAFAGWIFAPFVAGNLMKDLTAQQTTLHLKVYDGSESQDALIYDSNTEGTSTHEPAFKLRKEMNTAQQRWLLVWESTPAFEAIMASREPPIILIAGLLFTGLLGAFLLVIARRTASIHREVAQRTRELKRSQESTELLRKLAVTVSEVRTFEALIQAVLDSVCIYVDWPVGHAYLYDRGKQRLVSSHCWHIDDTAAFSAFREISEKTEFAAGVGLPGRVLTEKRALWIENVVPDDGFPRADELALIGLRGAFAFPVLVNNEVSLVLEFFSPTEAPPNPDLLALLGGIGAQLSRAVERTLLEQELHGHEARHQQLVDGVQDYAIYWIDPNGRVESWNSGAERIKGYTAKEIIGQHFSLFYTKEDQKKGLPYQTLNTALADGKFEGEGWRVRKNGNKFWASVVIAPIHDHQGTFTGFAKVIRDITERRQFDEALKVSEETFRSAMEHSSVGMGLAEPSGRWLKVNKALCDLVGYSEQEMMQTDFQSMTHPDDKEADTEYIRQMFAGDIITLQLEKRYLHKDGRIIWILLNVSLVRNADNSPRYFVAQIYDITARKQVDSLKTEFISTVSHELRTPLTSIRGALGLIEGGAAGVLPEKAAGLVKIAHKNSERLVRIINDILDIEKIESGKIELHIEKVRVQPFLKSALEANQAYGEKFGVRFLLDQNCVEAEVSADPDRLMQVMANLLSNGAKFSPPGSEIIVRAKRADKNIHFEIEDHGAGIPEAFRSRIFRKFSQADGSSTRAYEGTGLGLSITKQLVEAMKGNIGFHTEIGEGSVFYFDLPAAETEQNIVPAAELSIAESVSQRILICEDDSDIALPIKTLLEQAGFKADIARTTREARRLLNENHYAAMTVDLLLPLADGGEFLRETRSNPVTQNLPVVVVSARADEEKKLMGSDAIGVVDWLMKPIDQTRLVRSLRWAVERSQEAVPCVLHVEDDLDLSKILAAALHDKAKLVTAPTLRKAKQELRTRHFDLVILDLAMSDGSGLDLLQHLNELAGYSIPVLILSASEVTHEVQQQVAAALVKSRMSENKIVETIMSLLNVPPERRKESA